MTEPDETLPTIPPLVVASVLRIEAVFPRPIPGELADEIMQRIWATCQMVNLGELTDPRLTIDGSFKVKLRSSVGFRE